MNEVWIDIKGYEGYYKVSNFGRIISIGRRGGSYNKDIIMSLKGRQVTLCRDNIKVQYIISHIVYTHFVGEIPENMVVDHIVEGDFTNNRVDNLQLLTKKQNSTKARTLGRYKVGSKHGRTNVTDDVAINVINDSRNGVKRKYILSKYSITPFQYYNIIGDRFWKHLKY